MRSMWTVLAVCVLPPATALAGGAGPDVALYEIDATVLADSVKAKVRLTAATEKAPSRWELELSRRMEIRSLTVNGAEVPSTRDGERLVLDLSKLPREVRSLTLEAVVAGSPKGGGQGRKSTWISPEHARIRGQNPWYPRVAGDPAAYRTVISARKDWMVRTAGVEKSVVLDGERRVWTYEQEAPVREIGLVAGQYEVTKLDAGGLALEAWTLPGDEKAAKGILEIAKDAFDRYREMFGEVELDRYSILEMPAEYGTMSGYGEAGYILLGKGAFERGGESPATVALVVHEVAHSWWGHEVRFAHFAHESLASYATLRYLAARSESEALAVRERAVKRVGSLARAGKEIALSDIRHYGRGLDRAIYDGHAYEKGMMVLAMVEDALGAKKMDKLLAGFLLANRGGVVTWADLRGALAKGGSAARTLLDQWERVGIPTLTVEHIGKQAGRKWKVSGTVTQSGTEKPFRLKVYVVAVCGEERVEKIVELKRQAATFSMTTPGEPEAIVLDPGRRLLVDAPREEFDVEKARELVSAVVRDPGMDDPARCRKAIALLLRLIERGAGESEGYYWSGIGRCHFRLGEDKPARENLEKAILKGAGPHHRGWIHLRLGNIADVAGEREKALEHYRKVVASGSGASKGARLRAERHIGTPFRRK